MLKRLRDWLSDQIESADRRVDETEFYLDQQLYNHESHVLRRVRDKVKELEKDEQGRAETKG